MWKHGAIFIQKKKEFPKFRLCSLLFAWRPEVLEPRKHGAVEMCSREGLDPGILKPWLPGALQPKSSGYGIPGDLDPEVLDSCILEFWKSGGLELWIWPNLE